VDVKTLNYVLQSELANLNQFYFRFGGVFNVNVICDCLVKAASESVQRTYRIALQHINIAFRLRIPNTLPEYSKR
jgi:hypothetical protein